MTPRSQCVLVLMLSVPWALCGCQADRRITLAELATREKDAAPSATASAPAPTSYPALADLQEYRIRPGDVLAVKMVGLFEERYQPLLLDLRVYVDGDIVLPIVGRVAVGGMTLGDAELAIMNAHVPRVVKDLSVFVQLSGPETTTVLVQGAVTAPGLVRLNQNQRNLLFAVSLAGGFTTTSSGHIQFQPIDGRRSATTFNLNDPNDVRAMLAAPPLDSGDIINVEPENESAVFVSGLVMRPGPILIPPKSRISLLRALAAAGGLPEYIDVKEATLVRRLDDGTDAHVKLPLKDILAGTAPDVDLRPGDVLNLPFTADTFVQQWAKNNLLLGPFNLSLHYDPLAQYNANRALDQNNNNGGVAGAVRQSLGSTIPNVIVPPVSTVR